MSSLQATFQPGATDEFWSAVWDLIARAPTLADLRSHGLHLLAAQRWRSVGRPAPADLVAERRLATARVLALPRVLERIRAACDGPIILIKGYEVAVRYPEPASRPFDDVDVLVPEPERVYEALRRAGFVPVGYEESYYASRHHLRPLLLPELGMVVEVHRRPEWVRWSKPPPADELIEHAVVSGTGVDGILAPAPAQHALLLAAHSWASVPLRRLLDSIDTIVLAAEAPSEELCAWAARWDLSGLWRFTRRFDAALLAGGAPPAAVRLWGRSALAVRDMTVLENHERRVLGSFAVLPPHRALRYAAGALVRELVPEEGERWRTKLGRGLLALRHAFVGRTRHESSVSRREERRR